eukprot:SAG11_NODE_784_length_7187_cov_2.920429_6_plen_85_part_00
MSSLTVAVYSSSDLPDCGCNNEYGYIKTPAEYPVTPLSTYAMLSTLCHCLKHQSGAVMGRPPPLPHDCGCVKQLRSTALLVCLL